MTRQIIFNDQITLWWEYEASEKRYECYLNGNEYSKVKSTHVSFEQLTADTEYYIKVVGESGKIVFGGIIRTKKAKNKLDVSRAPYNAVGDGKTLNTLALQRALDDCTENDYVYIPNGVFLSGALRMHSHSELYLEQGSVLQGTTQVEDYLPKIKSRFEGLEFMCYSSLINAGELDSAGECNCEDITIRGKGRIVGGGNPLRANILNIENKRLREYITGLGENIKEFETKDTIAGRFRGRLINISNVDGFIISGVGVESSPSWNLHMVYSKNLTVYNCKFVSHEISNGDGIDPDSVENCAIFNCEFDTSDDCIAIKSGRNPEGNIVNRKSSNIYVFDCVASGHSICIGSEMSGGVENVYVWDCDMRETYCGFQLKFHKKRGGYIKNVRVNRSKLSRFTVWSARYNNDGEGAPTISQISDFSVEDCEIYGDAHDFGYDYKYVLLSGIDSENPIRNGYFNNITLKPFESSGQAIIMENVENISFGKMIKE